MRSGAAASRQPIALRRPRQTGGTVDVGGTGGVQAPGPTWLHAPSDSPGTFTQRNASASRLPVFVVGRGPRPRPGGLHQSCLSGYATVACQGPRPSRLVSTTKCVVGCTEPSIDAQRESMPTV